MNNSREIELNIEELLLQNGMLDEHFRLQDIRDRKLYLNDDICMHSVEEIVKHIIRFNTEDRGIPYEERKPIRLYISSAGGEVYSGFQLIDAIINSKTPIYTINMGYWLSMGFLIGLAGHKRFATQNAKFLWHDGMTGSFNSSAKVRDEIEFQEKNDARIRQFVLDRTNITKKLYDKKFRVEWYMFADDAKKFGVTDFIVGEDCDIDAIL